MADLKADLVCPHCHHEWSEYMALPILVEAGLARMKAWDRCPRCGKRGSLTKKISYPIDKPNP